MELGVLAHGLYQSEQEWNIWLYFKKQVLGDLK